MGAAAANFEDLFSCRMLRDGVFGADAVLGTEDPPGTRTAVGGLEQSGRLVSTERPPAWRRVFGGELARADSSA